MFILGIFFFEEKLSFFTLLIFVLWKKKRSWKTNKMKGEEVEKGDCGPPTRKVFLRFCQTWTKRYLTTSQTRVKHVIRIHHRSIHFSRMVRWCIRKANTFDSRLWGDSVLLGSSPTKSQKNFFALSFVCIFLKCCFSSNQLFGGWTIWRRLWALMMRYLEDYIWSEDLFSLMCSSVVSGSLLTFLLANQGWEPIGCRLAVRRNGCVHFLLAMTSTCIPPSSSTHPICSLSFHTFCPKS